MIQGLIDAVVGRLLRRKPVAPAGRVLKSGRIRLPKPRQATIISSTTARRLNYLENNGLADFTHSNLMVAMPTYRAVDGTLKRFPKGTVHGGV